MGVCAWVLFTVSCFGHSKYDIRRFKSRCKRDYRPPLLFKRSPGHGLRVITGHKKQTDNTSDACVACSKYLELNLSWSSVNLGCFLGCITIGDNISDLHCVICLSSLSAAQIIYRYRSGLSDSMSSAGPK